MVELAGVTASNHCLHPFWKLNIFFQLSFRVVEIAFSSSFLRGFGEKHVERLADSLLCLPVPLTFKVFSTITVWLLFVTAQQGKS